MQYKSITFAYHLKNSIMKATEKKSVIEFLGFEVKDYATKSAVIVKGDNFYKSFCSIHSAYKSIVK